MKQHTLNTVNHNKQRNSPFLQAAKQKQQTNRDLSSIIMKIKINKITKNSDMLI